jgi:tripartite-type tricarboxylate transporter receptor subunit TctC
VPPDLPAKNVTEFIALARQSPGKMTMGNAGPGSSWNLAASALEEKTGTKFSQVPFQGAAPAVLALMGGHIDAVPVSPAEVTTYVKSGKLKMLAVAADQRAKGFENVPTLKERGIDLSIGVWRGLAAPKNTPPEVLAYLEKVTKQAVDEPVFRKALDDQNLGFSFADAAGFKATIEKDNVYFKALVEKLGIKS